MNSEIPDATLRVFPGTAAAVELFAAESQVPALELLQLALDGLDELAKGCFEPLGVELTVSCLDPELDYPLYGVLPTAPTWFLQGGRWPRHVDIEPMLGESERRTVDRIDRGTIRELVVEALKQPAPRDGLGVTWTEIAIRAIRMRLPDLRAFEGRNELVLDIDGDAHRVPLERDDRGLWIAGPLARHPTQPPIVVRLGLEAGALRLDLEMHWSLWADEGEPGRAALDAGLDALIARGWSAL